MKADFPKKAVYAAAMVAVIIIVVLTLLFVNRPSQKSKEIVRFTKDAILSITVIDDKEEIAKIKAFLANWNFRISVT